MWPLLYPLCFSPFCASLPSILSCSDSPASVNHFIAQPHTHIQRKPETHTRGLGRRVMKLAKCFQPGSPSCLTKATLAGADGSASWRLTQTEQKGGWREGCVSTCTFAVSGHEKKYVERKEVRKGTDDVRAFVKGSDKEFLALFVCLNDCVCILKMKIERTEGGTTMG